MKQDKVLLSYGSGGRYTRDFINNCILRYFKNESLKFLLDAAVLNLSTSKLAFSIDGYTITPIFFPGGDIGKLSICGTINDLLCVGAKPKFIAVSLIIEEGVEIEVIEKVLSSMKRTSQEEDVLIVTGDTKVVEKGSCDKIFITTAGIGIIDESLSLHYSRIEPEDKIIVTGSIAEHGLSVLLSRGAYGFKYNIQSDCASLKSLLQKIFDDTNLTPYIKFLRDPTRGGISAVLNEIIEYRNDLILEVYEEKIPISKTAKHICELLSMDPLNIANEGKMLMVVSPNVSDKIIEVLKTHYLGKDASVIGKVSSSSINKGKVILYTSYGGKRILDMPSVEELPRIC
ncbi:MAG: hydrogenase expression/formation protein HypE [Endomicrobia bacterium]|nr:hydrogenase expression/formation protein HypE [Endomicrobiia bacterium]